MNNPRWNAPVEIQNLRHDVKWKKIWPKGDVALEVILEGRTKIQSHSVKEAVG